MLILGSLDLYLLQYLTITTKTTLKSIAATNIIVSDPITPPSTAPTLNDGVSRAAIIKNNVLLQCRHEKCIRANVHSATFTVHLISSKLQDMCIIIYIDCKKSEQEILHYPVIIQEISGFCELEIYTGMYNTFNGFANEDTRSHADSATLLKKSTHV